MPATATAVFYCYFYTPSIPSGASSASIAASCVAASVFSNSSLSCSAAVVSLLSFFLYPSSFFLLNYMHSSLLLMQLLAQLSLFWPPALSFKTASQAAFLFFLGFHFPILLQFLFPFLL
ncbi:hypothetical protein M9H77_26147 [Catharanthus roseus]|uniref:Uncharacterized protein n=1 Tax=Catharanthus roseus TaxID=4058 RepID=A0ACC0A958_CATRO|nr:hypothetical protein M9H77_26147 [Catharanthus roseus]